MSTSRMRTYVPLIQKFAASVVLLHSTVAGKLGLHVTDLKSLRLLGGDSMTAGGLGEEVGLTGAAVTALIDRLENAGYVVRQRGSDDRRRVTVHAVPEKLREIDSLYEEQGARMSKLLSKYSAEQFAVITDFLEKTTVILAEEAKKLRDKPQVGGADAERSTLQTQSPPGQKVVGG
jgi:DNA-binding MarR family transcriptional regulator